MALDFPTPNFLINVQYNLNGLNMDGSFNMEDSNLFLSP